MLSASGQHLHRRIAILFAGEVRAAPVVRSEIGCTRIIVGFAASESEAAQVTQVIRAKWPDEP